MRRFSPANAIFLILGLLVLLVLPARVQAQAADPSALAGVWVAALNAHDYAAALTLTVDDAFLIFVATPDGNVTTYEGKDQIRQALQGYGNDNAHIDLIEQPHVENGTLIWTEQLSSTSLRSLAIPSVQVTANAILEANAFKSVLYELTPGSARVLAQALTNPRNKQVHIDPLSPISALAGISTSGTTGGGITGMPRAGQETSLPAWLAVASLLLLLAGLALRVRVSRR